MSGVLCHEKSVSRMCLEFEQSKESSRERAPQGQAYET